MKQEDKEDTKHNIPSQVHESLEVYLKSPEFLESFRRITFSTLEEQENSNRVFSASLTPFQRMEYLYFLNMTFLSEEIKSLPSRFTKLYFD